MYKQVNDNKYVRCGPVEIKPLFPKYHQLATRTSNPYREVNEQIAKLITWTTISACARCRPQLRNAVSTHFWFRIFPTFVTYADSPAARACW
jgi:hypothetical protein